ncbi:MAG TPA: sugar nucleotide-binding protein, partial [Candidatus Dormibacteraeota bacterium]|nr:sugar nucleotide-binding protein [Candidatus Dormibacteraeota bacterium]
MRVLILGAGGQLGRALGPALRARGHDPIELMRAAADLTVPDQVTAALDRHQPSVVVNAAAYTAVDRAEQEAGLAFAVNAYSLRPLVQACATQ